MRQFVNAKVAAALTPIFETTNQSRMKWGVDLNHANSKTLESERGPLILYVRKKSDFDLSFIMCYHFSTALPGHIFQ